jgi:RNA polymerase sigma-70 factor (ECF subfamily)
MLVADDDWNRIVESRNGDGNAFELLVREHQSMIYSLCYRMTGSPTEAEDLTQETFIQAHRNLGGFRAESRFSSWLYRIALNLCLNWQKRKQRQDRLHQQWAEQAAEPPAEDPGHAARIQAALLKLHPKQRAAIVLTVYEGLSHAEAARALNCAEATVSWRVFAARAKLKRLLKDLSGQQTP